MRIQRTLRHEKKPRRTIRMLRFVGLDRSLTRFPKAQTPQSRLMPQSFSVASIKWDTSKTPRRILSWLPFNGVRPRERSPYRPAEKWLTEYPRRLSYAPASRHGGFRAQGLRRIQMHPSAHSKAHPPVIRASQKETRHRRPHQGHASFNPSALRTARWKPWSFPLVLARDFEWPASRLTR